jgi:large subunit ribosomal protein L22
MVEKKNSKQEKKTEDTKKVQKEEVETSKKDKDPNIETKVEEKKEEKKPVVKKPKKQEAVVHGKDIPISTKKSIAICKFIKGKKINEAIKDLEDVLAMKRPVPMKGEIPHRKGKGMMSGRFPIRATKNFVVLLKSLSGNVLYNSMEDPVIVEAVANQGARAYGRFGRHRKKRTHIKIVAKEITPKVKETK